MLMTAKVGVPVESSAMPVSVCSAGRYAGHVGLFLVANGQAPVIEFKGPYRPFQLVRFVFPFQIT